MCEDSTISRLLRYLEHLTSYTRSRCYTLVYVLGICLSLCCVSNSTNAQVAELYGLVNGTLLSIDTSNAEITEVTDLQTPSGWELIRLAFNTNDCLFYTIANPANSPHLISFDFDGNYTDIGLITLPGQQIYVIEGLDFNNFDKKMYASVSIDNTLGSGDTYCETLVEINTSDATAAIRASLATNATVEDDMDDISFIEDELFLNDIATSGSANFYALPLGGSGALLNPMLIGSQAFDLVTDIEGIDTKLFYCNILRELKVMDVVSGNVTNLGTTHGLFDYFGLPIVGLDFVTIETLELFPEDSVVCQSDGLELNIDVGQSSVLWNNGIQNATIQISTAGMYYATVTIDNCNYYTDTINVVFVDCDSCTSIGQSVLPSLSLGGTPFVCEGDSLFIDMGLSDSFMVAWNNGNTGAQTYFDAAGNYWAEVTYGACSWFTDTLMPQFVPCDTCINFEAQVLAAIDLGEDVDLCIGDSWDFTVNLDPSFDVQWNTGLNNNSISTNIAGTYSVEVIYGDCSWLSDSIEVGFLDCDSCATLEQEIANDLLLGPDQVLCEGSSLQLLLLLDDDYDITWSNGVNDILINVVDAGNYWAEVSYGACQWTTDTIAIAFEVCDSCSVIENEISAELMLGSDATLCIGDSMILEVDVDPTFSVIWNNGLGSNEIVAALPGNYWAEISYGACQWTTDTIAITFEVCDSCSVIENEISAELMLGSDATLCIGDSMILEVDVDPTFSVIWNNGLGSNEIVAALPGNYWAEVNYGACQWTTDTIAISFEVCDSCSVIENEISAELMLGSDATLCIGDSMILEVDVDPTFSVIWNNGLGSNEIVAALPGNYWAEVNYGACQWTTDTIAISFEVCDSCSVIENEISAELMLGSDATLCIGDSMILEVDVDPTFSVIWNNGLGSNEIVAALPGNYWAEVNYGACQWTTDTIAIAFEVCDSCSVIENEISAELMLGSDTTLCIGDSMILEVDVDPTFSVIWNNGLGSNEIVAALPGNYWAEVNYGACQWTTDTIAITFEVCDSCSVIENEISSELMLGSDATLCIGDSMILEVDVDPSFSVVWNNGLGSNEIIAKLPGNYWAEVSYGACQWTTDTIAISFEVCDSCSVIENEISAELMLGADATLCIGDSMILEVDVDPTFSVIWNNGLGSNEIVAALPGNYWAEVSYGACQWTTDTIAITFEDCDSCSEKRNEIADELILGSGYHFCTEAVELSLDLDGEYHVLWSTGDTSKQIYVNEVGYYFAQVQYGVCQWKTDTTFVTNFECPPESCKYFIPNAFSPNGDDINDYFKVYFDVLNCAVEVFNIKIYNRWGALVYQSNENTWDGYFAGAKMNPGVYAYVIEMQINSGLEIQTYIESGEVYLME